MVKNSKKRIINLGGFTILKKQYISFAIVVIIIIGVSLFFREPSEETVNINTDSDVEALEQEIIELESQIEHMKTTVEEWEGYFEEALYEVYINSKNYTVPNNPDLKKLYEELFVNTIISSVLSKDEERYYLVVLGASQEMRSKIHAIINSTNIISGSTMSGDPSDRWVRALGIENELTILLFDSEKEIFRTNNIEELNDFITEHE